MRQDSARMTNSDFLPGSRRPPLDFGFDTNLGGGVMAMQDRKSPTRSARSAGAQAAPLSKPVIAPLASTSATWDDQVPPRKGSAQSVSIVSPLRCGRHLRQQSDLGQI